MPGSAEPPSLRAEQPPPPGTPSPPALPDTLGFASNPDNAGILKHVSRPLLPLRSLSRFRRHRPAQPLPPAPGCPRGLQRRSKTPHFLLDTPVGHRKTFLQPKYTTTDIIRLKNPTWKRSAFLFSRFKLACESFGNFKQAGHFRF